MFKVVVLILSLLVISSAHAQNRATLPLLTEPSYEVKMLRISYNGQQYKRRSISLNSSSNSATLFELIKLISATKLKTYLAPTHSDRQESDPKYQLAITYNNGEVDFINANESGRYFYRLLANDDGGYTGGGNEQVLPLIHELFAQAKNNRAEQAAIEIIKADFVAHKGWEQHQFEGKTLYLSSQKGLSNGDFLNVMLQHNPYYDPSAIIKYTLSLSGSYRFRKMTEPHIGKPVVIMVDGKILMAPKIVAVMTSPVILMTTMNSFVDSQKRFADLLSSLVPENDEN